MDTAAREAVLRTLLPGLGVVLVYGLMFNRTGELTAARASLNAAEASAVAPSALFPARMKLGETAAENKKITGEKEVADVRWSQLTALSATSSPERTAALRQLTKMLWDRGLYPFDESPAETSDQLPGSFDELLKKLAGPGTSAAPRLWKVRFYGRYADVAETLAALGELDSAIVPVSLTMSESRSDTSWRVWTLVLWV